MKIAIHTPTESEYLELMQKLEEKEYEWTTGLQPTDPNYFKEYKDDTHICIDDKELSYSNKAQAMYDEYTIFAYSDLKANNFKIEIQL